MTSPLQKPVIAVLVACFNRKDKTLRALDALFQQQSAQRYSLRVVLVDDSSTDGTGDAVAKRFSCVEIIKGSGSLFWNGAMRVAFARAMLLDPDYYLMLNDDTVLRPNGIIAMLDVALARQRESKTAIVTGSTVDPISGICTYGGLFEQKALGLRKFVLIQPMPESIVAANTIHCNCALIPRLVAQELGNLEKRFRHQWGDWDYGLRAQKAGFEVWVAPGFVGECSANPVDGTWRDSSLSMRKRWRHLMGPKGIPYREWIVFTRRHYGAAWPLYLISPYVKTIFPFMTVRQR